MQLQDEKKPQHMTMSLSTLDCFIVLMYFFSMLQRNLAEVGGAHILNETCVIEKGSLKSFDAKDLINYL